MTAPSIDPTTVKTGQRASWDAISPGWEDAMGVFERGAAAVTGRLLELAGVGPGHRVLDVATGLGEPALSAARAAGPTGRVVGADISPRMLAAARRRAAAAPDAAALAPLEFVQADVESIGLPAGSFDAVLSRWGLMFACDHAAAFAGLRRLLAPGGVLAAAVWAPPPDVPMIGLGYRVLAGLLDLPAPPPGMPGPFSMSDPAALSAELRRAGFAEVSVEEFAVPFRLDRAAEYADFNKAVSPPSLLDAVRDRFGSPDAPGVWDAVAAAVEPYADDGGGIELTSTALCVRAVAGRDRAGQDGAVQRDGAQGSEGVR
jgi:SAM-dependent methyltransferase